MKKTGKKFFSVIMAVLVVLTMTVSAFALMENVSTINTNRTGVMIFPSRSFKWVGFSAIMIATVKNTKE